MADNSDNSRKGYVIVQEEITDREQYLNEYIPPATETLQEYDAEVIVGAPDPDVLEGEWDHNMTVVIEFPSVEDAHEWYNDETYEEVRQIRHDASEYANLVIAPEFSPEDLQG